MEIATIHVFYLLELRFISKQVFYKMQLTHLDNKCYKISLKIPKLIVILHIS